MECKDTLITWLNNAYAMELSMAETLEKHAEALEGELPDIRDEIEQHIMETRDQAEKVKEEIERLGGDTSSIKATMSSMFGSLSGILSDMPKDKIVKNAIAEHAAEHFEMATYMAIAELADMCDEEETAKMARNIAMEEKTTSEKLQNKFEKIIATFREEKMDEE